MKVRIVAHTVVVPGAMAEAGDGMYDPDVEPGMLDQSSALTQFAGRACYASWLKPNPATATHTGYAHNIIGQRHFSVMEHGSVTFYITDVSRSLTHELIRHRHASYSQLSQRFVPLELVDREKHPEKAGEPFVVAPLFRGAQATQDKLQAHWEASVRLYNELVDEWYPLVLQTGVGAHRARKQVREAARSVLPNMTPTAIVMTGNHRAWRELLEKRGSIHADAEIRELVIEIFQQLYAMEPALYQDFELGVEEGQTVLLRRELDQ